MNDRARSDILPAARWIYRGSLATVVRAHLLSHTTLVAADRLIHDHLYTHLSIVITPMTASIIMNAFWDDTIRENLSEGIQIAIAGMVIVASALALISLFIATLPHLLAVIGKFWPDVEASHSRHARTENLVSKNEAVLAAIGYVLHCEVQKRASSERSVD